MEGANWMIGGEANKFEDFFEQIDDLLDISNEEIAGTIGETGSFSNCVSETAGTNGTAQTQSRGFYSQQEESGDLPSVPYEDLAGLEWPSTFKDDPFLQNATKASCQFASAADEDDKFRSSSPISVLESGYPPPAASPLPGGLSAFEVEVPAKARRKRRKRAPAGIWPCRIFPPLSSSEEEEFVRKKKKKRENEVRKCEHCGTERTPQWRAGPNGPKTLCNACGVRYKSGRLLPEYRPAASPTFSLLKHSNSHKKVLELRRLKELMLTQRPRLQAEEFQ